MSRAPNTPDDWITVRIQGYKADLGPQATVDDVLETVRRLIGNKSIRVPGGTAARHRYTPERYAVVKKSDVGMKEDGSEWNPPEGPEDFVPWSLPNIEDGDELRAYSVGEDEQPAYPEYDG